MAEKYFLLTKQQYIHFILNIEQIPNSKTSDGNGSGNGFQRQHINVNKMHKMTRAAFNGMVNTRSFIIKYLEFKTEFSFLTLIRIHNVGNFSAL